MLPERQLLDALGQGVVAIALDGSLVYANPATERLFGWPVAELIGRPVLELATALPPESTVAVDEILAALRAGGSWRGELSLTRRGGVPFLAGVVATPITGTDGELVAILAVCDDLTDRRLVDEELSASRERLRLAMGAARM
ncbi:MAG: PAS domain-containing protein, partial [Actinomycetota bacterium]